MAAELKIGIGADNSGLNKGLQDAEKQITAFVSKIDKIANIGDQLSSIGQKMSVGLTLPILALGGSAIKAYGDIQSLQKGLEAVMGSGAAAGKEFEKLKDVARLPGLGMEEAVRGSINLQAIGMDADKSRKILSQFGNAVASVGKGKAEFERAIYGVQQLANTDFPLGEDLNIIKDALPQVSNLLKEAFGSSRSDELAKMGISSKQVLDTITAGLEKLPRVTGGINGAFENLGDSMKTSLARIGKIIDDTFDISGIIDKLTGYLDTAISYFENLSPAVQKTILVVTGLAAAAGPLLVVIGGLMSALPTIITGLGAVKVALVALTGPIGLVVAGIGAIIATVVSNWDKINPYFRGTVEWFRRLYNESAAVRIAVNAISGTFKASFAVVGDILTGVWRSIKAFGKGILELFAGVGGVIEGALTLDFSKIQAGYSRGFAAINGTASSFVTIFKDTVKNIGGSIFNPNLSLPKISVSSNIDPALPNEVEKVVGNEIKKGLKKVKDTPLTVELSDVTPITQSTVGFVNALGETFDTFQEYDQRSRELSARINANISGIPTTISETTSKISELTQYFNNSLKEILNQSITNTIADSFSALGQAIASGENGFAAAGKSLLSSFGGFMQDLGKMAIAYGVEALALKMALKSFNPYIAIAAGAALVAIGSVFSSKMSSMGSNYAGGGSYSTSAGSSTSSGNFTSSSFTSGSGSGGEVVFRISGSDLLGVLKRADADFQRLN